MSYEWLLYWALVAIVAAIVLTVFLALCANNGTVKVYLVVDGYQYDGGFTVFAIFRNPDLALIRQQQEKRKIVREWVEYERKWPNSRSIRHEPRLESITIHEMEISE